MKGIGIDYNFMNEENKFIPLEYETKFLMSKLPSRRYYQRRSPFKKTILKMPLIWSIWAYLNFLIQDAW